MILLFDIEMIEKLKLGINAWSCYLNREYKIRKGSTYPLPVLFNNKLRNLFKRGIDPSLHKALLGSCQNPLSNGCLNSIFDRILYWYLE